MNYSKIYNDFIDKARKRKLIGVYSERHHIIPKCMNGIDDESNLVDLLPREHFIAHRLLTKMYPTVRGLHLAVNLMRYNSGVKLTSRTIASLREENSKISSGANNPRFGKPAWNKGTLTPESTKIKMRKAHKGKVISSEARSNMSKARKGRFFGKDSPRYGLPNPRRGDIWEFYDELYELWLYNEKPKRTRFNKLAVSNGYPDVSYRRLIENFERKI